MIDLVSMILRASGDPQDWREISDVARDDGAANWFVEALADSALLAKWFLSFAERGQIHRQCNVLYNRRRTNPSFGTIDAWVWRFHTSPQHGEDRWGAVTVPHFAWSALNSLDDLRAKNKKIESHILAWMSYILPAGEYRIEGTVEWWIVVKKGQPAVVGRELLRQRSPDPTIVL